MKVSYHWLKEFVAVTATPEELAARLALAGTNIAGIEHGPHGAVIDAEITSNRPDCLGLLGIAREVGAIYRLPVKSVLPKPLESPSAKAADAVSVKIEAPEMCGRFTARVVRGVKIQPSPAWLKERVEAAGSASINNVVDVSNYVMLELGHPLHTFDYNLVGDHSLVVRRARKTRRSVPSMALNAHSIPVSPWFAMETVPALSVLAASWAARKPKSPSPPKMF